METIKMFYGRKFFKLGCSAARDIISTKEKLDAFVASIIQADYLEEIDVPNIGRYFYNDGSTRVGNMAEYILDIELCGYLDEDYHEATLYIAIFDENKKFVGIGEVTIEYVPTFDGCDFYLNEEG